MKAKAIMKNGSVCCNIDQNLAELIEKLDEADYRFLPVVDDAGKLLGILDSVGVLSRSVPPYISNDSLGELHYAPDMGVMLKEYTKLMDLRVRDVMEDHPPVVEEDESILSVSSTLLHHLREDHFEPVLVVDAEHRYVGMITAGSVLRALHTSYLGSDGGACDA